VTLAAGATFTQLRRVATAIDVDPKGLAQWVKRRRDRVALLPARLDGSPLAPLATAMAIDDPRVRVAETNEALGDLAAEVSWGEAIPDAALRGCIFATLLAVAGVVIGRDDLVPRLVDVLVVGVCGTLIVADARRVARAYGARWRTGLDAWVAASVDPSELAGAGEGRKSSGSAHGGRRRSA
jgi:hypothetical protein